MVSDKQDLCELEKRIGYQFRNGALLLTALKHKSALEGKTGSCNDRLEWLGDRVVGLFIADYLFSMYEKPRSWLAGNHSKLASEEYLAWVARKISLGRYLILGRGEEQSVGREKDSILSSALEALIGAVFVDSGSFEITEKVMQGVFCSNGGLEHILLQVNYKGLLQSLCLRLKECLPEYQVLFSSPELAPHYRVAALVKGKTYAVGEGKSKKKAEQVAARKTWEKLVSENIAESDTPCA